MRALRDLVTDSIECDMEATKSFSRYESAADWFLVTSSALESALTPNFSLNKLRNKIDAGPHPTMIVVFTQSGIDQCRLVSKNAVNIIPVIPIGRRVRNLDFIPMYRKYCFNANTSSSSVRLLSAPSEIVKKNFVP